MTLTWACAHPELRAHKTAFLRREAALLLLVSIVNDFTAFQIIQILRRVKQHKTTKGLKRKLDGITASYSCACTTSLRPLR